MNISTNLATNILYQMKQIIHQDLNYIDTSGTIIASTDPERVGTFHEASLRCIKKGEQIIINSDDEYAGSKKGINMPIYFNDSIIGVIGITGNKDEVEKFGEIIRMMTSILIKEAWIKDQDIRKREINKAFIERIILEYDHDFFPMSNFLFPYYVIVGQLENHDVIFGSDNIYNSLNDFLYNQNHFFTISRNEIIILFHHTKNNNINSNVSSEIFKLKKELFEKNKLNFKFGIGNLAVDYESLKDSYKNAKEILKISSHSANNDVILEYDKIDLELLFFNLKVENTQSFKNKILKNFSEKEIKEFSNLLKIYEENNGSIIHTSEKLFMHKNTLQYKLNKIHKLSGYNPRNLKDFVILSLAFKLELIK